MCRVCVCRVCDSGSGHGMTFTRKSLRSVLLLPSFLSFSASSSPPPGMWDVTLVRNEADMA